MQHLVKNSLQLCNVAEGIARRDPKCAKLGLSLSYGAAMLSQELTLMSSCFFFISVAKKYLFYVYEHTVAVFRPTRREHWIP